MNFSNYVISTLIFVMFTAILLLMRMCINDGELIGELLDANLELELEIDNLQSEIEELNLELLDYIIDKMDNEDIVDKPVALSHRVVDEPDKVLLGTFEATAYTDDIQSQGKWVGQTATGRKPQVGVIAVDPKVIPLETKLYVEGYGECVAGDVGGVIKGNIIDVFLDTRPEVKEWGRKQVKVWEVIE